MKFTENQKGKRHKITFSCDKAYRKPDNSKTIAKYFD